MTNWYNVETNEIAKSYIPTMNSVYSTDAAKRLLVTQVDLSRAGN